MNGKQTASRLWTPKFAPVQTKMRDARRELSTDQLAARAIHRRAIEAVIWGMPAVNAELMFAAMKYVGAGFNQVVYWSRPANWKNQTLTPNPDTIYLMPFFNTKNAGPMVLEIPPAEAGASITGSINDAWQTPLEDVGPAGADHGKGGKYLILPPGYKQKTHEDYIPLSADVYTGFGLLRSNLASGSDVDILRAVEYGKRIRFYPMSQAVKRPETVFVDAYDLLFDCTIPYDLRFFETLDRFVQREPWLLRDRAMIDQLATIGIEKGKQFDPDDATRKILDDAAQEAHAWLDAGYEEIFSAPFYEGTHWAFPALPGVVDGLTTNDAEPDSYGLDGRGVAYSMAFSGARHPGSGQYYVMSIRDNAGEPLDGGNKYRLHIPPNPPVDLYWSATVYDRETHALFCSPAPSSRSSLTPGLVTNTDGSVDLFLGVKAPIGKEANWVSTSPHGKFEVLFRFYGPKKHLFEKTWRLPDIMKV